MLAARVHGLIAQAGVARVCGGVGRHAASGGAMPSAASAAPAAAAASSARASPALTPRRLVTTTAAPTPTTRAPPSSRATAARVAAGAALAAATATAGFALGGLVGAGLPPPRRPAWAQSAEPPTPTTLADAAPWVRELAAGDGVVEILNAEDLEKQAHLFLRADHMVR
jgi:hypothetical protein